jgi:transcriptional regulator with XRE-family HTH domain
MASSLWDSDNRVLQDLLKEMRVAAGLTQVELSNLLKRPQSYVSKYESGERRLDLTEVRSITISCGSSLKELVELLETILDTRA